jgi:hypothetical protein
MEPAGSGGTWTGSPKGVFAGRKHHKPRQALQNNMAGVREREDTNRTREVGNRDEVEGVFANTLNLFRSGAVGFIDWLDVGFPPVDHPPNNQTADTAEDKNRNVLVCDDGVRKADEQAKQQADKPARPVRQLDTTNDKSNGEATGECTEQRCRFVRKRHRQHKTDIQRSEYYTSDQT